MDKPQFNIHGKARRAHKRRIYELKFFLKDFWREHQMDEDMASFFGGTDSFPMSREKAQEIFDQKTEELNKLQEELAVPYKEI